MKGFTRVLIICSGILFISTFARAEEVFSNTDAYDLQKLKAAVDVAKLQEPLMYAKSFGGSLVDLSAISLANVSAGVLRPFKGLFLQGHKWEFLIQKGRCNTSH